MRSARTSIPSAPSMSGRSARIAPPSFCIAPRTRPAWPATACRSSAATGTSMNTPPAACGATPNYTKSAQAPARSAACSLAGNCSTKLARHHTPMIQDGDHRKIELPAPARVSAARVAATILDGFNRHYALFRYSAQRAKSLFEGGEWHQIQQLSSERIEYYDTRVRECVAHLVPALRQLAPQGAEAGSLAPEQQAFWQEVRSEFVGLLAGHRQPECAEPFFNSVSCRILHRDHYNNDFLFVRPAVATDYLDSRLPSYRSYYPLSQGLQAALMQMLAGFGLAAPMEDLPRDTRMLARQALRALRRMLPRHDTRRLAPDCQIQVLNTLFFRNKGAYAVGRLINHGTTLPFAIALLRRPSGHIYVDALLLGEDDLSALFSFTRAYFLVDRETPAAYVNFLSSLMPRKAKAELYTAIGLQKQGKTLFYRDFLQHLAHSHDHFDIAPGIHGLVM